MKLLDHLSLINNIVFHCSFLFFRCTIQLKIYRITFHYLYCYFELQNKRQEYLLKFIFYCISSFIIFCISALVETQGLIKNLFFNTSFTHLKSEFENLSDFFFKFYEYSNISFSIFIIFLKLFIINLFSFLINFF